MQRYSYEDSILTTAAKYSSILLQPLMAELESNAIDFVHFRGASDAFTSAVLTNGEYVRFDENLGHKTPPQKLRTRKPTTAYCHIDANTILAGEQDGAISFCDVKTGESRNRSRKHGCAIDGIDFWGDHVVSTDKNHLLKIHRLERGQLTTLYQIQLEYAPFAVKLVTIKPGVVQIMVVDSVNFNLNCTTPEHATLSLPLPRHGSSCPCAMVAFSLDATRTSYTVGVNHPGSGDDKPYMRITAGVIADHMSMTNYKVEGNFSNAQIAWNMQKSAFYVSDNPGDVHWLSTTGDPSMRLCYHTTALKKLLVYGDARLEHIFTVGSDRRVAMWAAKT